MSLEETTKNAYYESVTDTRKGDTTAELEEIKNYIRNSQKIIVPNHNDEKIKAINDVLNEFGLAKAEHLHFYTNCCDISRMPAVTKALMTLDLTNCDIVIARGRLGVPGSGSMLVILDYKGRVLSAALSPPHILHAKPLAEAVRDEMRVALERVGFKPQAENRDQYED